MARFSFNDLQTILQRATEAAGASAEAAQSLARQTAEAEAMGQFNHGVVHLLDYLNALRAGRIDGQAIPVITQPLPAIIHCALGGGLPQHGFDMAFDRIVATAKEFGLAAFCSAGGYTCGPLGTFTLRLADQGLVALAATNGPALLAGSGSRRPVFCTNPLAFAAPQDNGPPLLVDQASSMVAFAEIRLAAARGETIPADWAIDADGNPTTDPKAAMQGAMLAFGGTRGANIALMVEVLAAGVCGASWSLDAPSYIDGSQSPGTGLFVLAINPVAIAADFGQRMAAQLERLAKDHGVHIPGKSKAQALQRARMDGLEIGPDLLDRLKT